MDEKHAQKLRAEECRKLVRAYLAARRALAFRVEAIRRGLKREEAADFTDLEIHEELVFLKGLGFVAFELEPMGSTKNWQITSAGVLAEERE